MLSPLLHLSGATPPFSARFRPDSGQPTNIHRHHSTTLNTASIPRHTSTIVIFITTSPPPSPLSLSQPPTPPSWSPHHLVTFSVNRTPPSTLIVPPQPPPPHHPVTSPTSSSRNHHSCRHPHATTFAPPCHQPPLPILLLFI
ncbi:hypothetical protein Tco_1563842 [Tanacetum coccineum]